MALVMALTACGEAASDNGQTENGGESVCDLEVGGECFEQVHSETSERGRFPAPSHEIEGASAFYLVSDREVGVYYDIYTCGSFDAGCEGTYFPEVPSYESEVALEHRLAVQDTNEVFITFWISDQEEDFEIRQDTTWTLYRLLEIQ